MAISTPVTRTRQKAIETVETVEAVEITKASKNGKKSKSGEYPENLVQVLCIWYLVNFQKKFASVSMLFDSSSEVNAIQPTFISELKLLIRPTNIGEQKIDSTMLDTYGIVVAAFSVINKPN